jgi:MIP family channel proteins
VTGQAPARGAGTLALSGCSVAELLGTFVFVFSGTATVLAVHNLSHTTAGFTAVGDIAISLAFAFGVLAAVYMTAGVSGAHLNPAVTVALAVTGEFPWREAPQYILSQFTGALLAALMDWFMYGGTLRRSLILGSTHPGTGVPWWRATLTEFVITAVLMVVVMATAVYRRGPGRGAASGLAIGLWVGAAIFLALPISGGSLNPARTLGPDIVAAQFPAWWVYFLGPIVGAAFGAALWKFVIAKGSQEQVVAGAQAEDQRHAEDTAAEGTEAA